MSDDAGQVTRLRHLFEKVVDLPAPERAAYLDSRCDDALRAQLERMLALDGGPGAEDLPGTTAAAATATAIGTLPLPNVLTGSRIGSFELIEVLGEGGSSVVFRAKRLISGVRQDVALKLLRHGLYTDEDARRFRRELEVLAQLEHPGIARLIEGGVSDSGSAYIVLELVEGRAITRYAQDEALDPAARLRLFAAACRAVEAAHRALIVHRDLKPSNVLVSNSGDVKLVDFGISKTLQDDRRTQTLYAAFTPAFAAPEQRANAAITTATDVYALGMLLNELLGVPREAARQGKQVLRGDVAAIAAKATQTEPQHRYPSAGALADDVERLLAGQPVAAHPPSRTYRTRRFVSRHRWAVATAAGVLVAILATLSVALWQARIARQQAIAARTEAQRANAVRDFVERLFEPLRHGVAAGQQPSLTQLLDASTARLAHAPGLDVGSRVDLLAMFSRIYESLGELDKAEALANQAATLSARSLRPDDINRIRALIARGYVAARKENYAAAEPDLEEAYRRMRAKGIHGEPLINLLGPLGAVKDRQNQGERALQLAREALAERIRTFGPDDPRVGVGYNDVASALEGLGRYNQAIEAWRRTYAFQLAHYGSRSDETALGLGGWASASLRAGHWRTAHALFDRAMAVYERNGHKAELAEAYTIEKFCIMEALMAHRAHAKHRCAQARALNGASFGTQSSVYGDALTGTAISLFMSGDLAAARAQMQRARATYAHTATDRPRLGRVDSWLAAIDALEDNPAAARELLVAAIPDLQARKFPTPVLLARARLLLACTAAPASDCPVDLQASVATERQQLAASGDPRVLAVDVALARIDLRAGAADAAARRLHAALADARAELGEIHPRVLEASLWLAVAQARCNALPQARTTATKALRLIRQQRLDHHPLLAAALAAAQPLAAAPTMASVQR
ncbi:MAG TPA: serine/threonine-protein kinase [Rhodanobacteraceae bacterium]|nr:serine/threonine-protein kinase [Rhodanobacteraceae bacterium]